MNKNRVLIAGSTGYLGRNLVSELLSRGADFKALARSKSRLVDMGLNEQHIALAQVTDANTLYGCCDGIDTVISCVGITRQKDGIGYMDVDFQANLNLLREAEKAGVKKFIYISALNATKFPNVRLLKAKERFAAQLLASKKLKPCVIRPCGFYSDMEEFYSMAESGRVYLFGNGDTRLNPIHGEDLARFCLDAIDKTDRELAIGGPEIFSVNEIAWLAFSTLDKNAHVTYLPNWVRKCALLVASMLPEKFGGPAEFFLAAMARDMVAPVYGKRKLRNHFIELNQLEKTKH